MGKYLVLEGKHQGTDPFEKNGKATVTIHRKGDVIESDVDLCKMWNRPGCRKFRKLSESTPAKLTPQSMYVPPEDPFDEESEFTEEDHQETQDSFANLTIPELRSIAENNEIDLGKATRKEEIISALRIATGG